MLMVLSLAAFLALAASAGLGVLMLLAGTAMAAARRWRRAGVIALCAGACGTMLALLVMLVLSLLMDSRAGMETWLLFASSGFGWGALISLGLYVLLTLLQQPNRWIDRRRNSQRVAHVRMNEIGL
jgi:hypothetical protein